MTSWCRPTRRATSTSGCSCASWPPSTVRPGPPACISRVRLLGSEGLVAGCRESLSSRAPSTCPCHGCMPWSLATLLQSVHAAASARRRARPAKAPRTPTPRGARARRRHAEGRPALLPVRPERAPAVRVPQPHGRHLQAAHADAGEGGQPVPARRGAHGRRRRAVRCARAPPCFLRSAAPLPRAAAQSFAWLAFAAGVSATVLWAPWGRCPCGSCVGAACCRRGGSGARGRLAARRSAGLPSLPAACLTMPSLGEAAWLPARVGRAAKRRPGAHVRPRPARGRLSATRLAELGRHALARRVSPVERAPCPAQGAWTTSTRASWQSWAAGRAAGRAAGARAAPAASPPARPAAAAAAAAASAAAAAAARALAAALAAATAASAARACAPATSCRTTASCTWAT